MAQAADRDSRGSDFEAAIAECGFGLFNVYIMLCSMPCLTAMVFSAAAISYIMPTAECDLKLTLIDKGLMNAVTYAGKGCEVRGVGCGVWCRKLQHLSNWLRCTGMIISAIPWGFVADTMGRRLVLISGGWMDGFCVLFAAMSQNSRQLMVCKFFDGLLWVCMQFASGLSLTLSPSPRSICGPFAVVVSNLAEFHGMKHRHFIMLFVGVSISLGALVLPLLAYFLLPVHIFFNVGELHCEWTSCVFGSSNSSHDHLLAVHTWQIFLAVTAVPSLLSGFLYIFLPESPKFLMSQGNYSEALSALQRIYAMNKRKSRDSYPVSWQDVNLYFLLIIPPTQITTLKDATPERPAEASGPLTFQERWAKAKVKFMKGLHQLSPMFSSPYLGLSVRVYCLHFCQIMW